MYLIGKEHPNKERAFSILQRLIRDEERLVTDAEALQEILHRYRAIRRTDAIQPAFDTLLGLVDEVFPVEATDTVHAAVMRKNRVERLLSFDGDFDAFSFLKRIS